MRFSIRFKNASPKIHEHFGRASRWSIETSSVKDAERIITQGLRYAQAASIVVWLRHGYLEGRTDRKRWHGNLCDVVPELYK